MDETIWYLKNCDLFERLTPDQMARVELRSFSRKFAKGSLVYLPSDRGEAVLLLTRGRVKIYHLTGEGKQAVLALIEPGELFGELAVFDSGMREEFAETMEDSTVVMIPGGEVRRLMDEHPAVSLGATRLMGLKQRRVERRLKSLLFRSNRERLVHLLLELAEKYGKATEQGVLIDIRLAHQDLAGIIGSTRETVTVILGQLQREGSISIQRRRIYLTTMQRLADSIDATSPPLPAARPSAARMAHARNPS